MNLPFDHRFAPEKWARVHFIPNLKVGVFVTLRAPNVIKRRSIPFEGAPVLIYLYEYASFSSADPAL